MPPESVFSRLAQERTLFLYKDIDAQVATELAAHLLLLNSLDSSQEITLYINSSGGNVEDGLLTIYDAMQTISAPVKTICCGVAYSSAAVLLTAGQPGLRLSYPHARIMIHQVTLEDVNGNSTEIGKELKRVKKMNDIVLKILAKHSRQKLSIIKKDVEREDKFLTPKEAIKYGLIDAIISPSKAKSGH